MNENPTNKPHTAVLSVQLEVHSLLDTGECSGQILNAKVLEDYGIQPAFLVTVNGYTMDDCLTKLRTKLEDLKDEHV